MATIIRKKCCDEYFYQYKIAGSAATINDYVEIGYRDSDCVLARFRFGYSYSFPNVGIITVDTLGKLLACCRSFLDAFITELDPDSGFEIPTLSNGNTELLFTAINQCDCDSKIQDSLAYFVGSVVGSMEYDEDDGGGPDPIIVGSLGGTCTGVNVLCNPFKIRGFGNVRIIELNAPASAPDCEYQPCDVCCEALCNFENSWIQFGEGCCYPCDNTLNNKFSRVYVTLTAGTTGGFIGWSKVRRIDGCDPLPDNAVYWNGTVPLTLDTLLLQLEALPYVVSAKYSGNTLVFTIDNALADLDCTSEELLFCGFDGVECESVHYCGCQDCETGDEYKIPAKVGDVYSFVMKRGEQFTQQGFETALADGTIKLWWCGSNECEFLQEITDTATITVTESAVWVTFPPVPNDLGICFRVCWSIQELCENPCAIIQAVLDAELAYYANNEAFAESIYTLVQNGYPPAVQPESNSCFDYICFIDPNGVPSTNILVVAIPKSGITSPIILGKTDTTLIKRYYQTTYNTQTIPDCLPESCNDFPNDCGTPPYCDGIWEDGCTEGFGECEISFSMNVTGTVNPELSYGIGWNFSEMESPCLFQVCEGFPVWQSQNNNYLFGTGFTTLADLVTAIAANFITGQPKQPTDCNPLTENTLPCDLTNLILTPSIVENSPSDYTITWEVDTTGLTEAEINCLCGLKICVMFSHLTITVENPIFAVCSFCPPPDPQYRDVEILCSDLWMLTNDFCATNLVEFSNREDAFKFPYSEYPNFAQVFRCQLYTLDRKHEQIAEVYRESNGNNTLEYAQLNEVWTLESGYLDKQRHLAVKIALNHDYFSVGGSEYVRRKEYEEQYQKTYPRPRLSKGIAEVFRNTFNENPKC